MVAAKGIAIWSGTGQIDQIRIIARETLFFLAVSVSIHIANLVYYVAGDRLTPFIVAPLAFALTSMMCSRLVLIKRGSRTGSESSFRLPSFLQAKKAHSSQSGGMSTSTGSAGATGTGISDHISYPVPLAHSPINEGDGFSEKALAFEGLHAESKEAYHKSHNESSAGVE